MSIYEYWSPVELAAYVWWTSKRPVGWSEENHLKTPAINVSTPSEAHLALAVAYKVQRPLS